MALKAIDGTLLKTMLASGAALLEKSKGIINDLNVFPVPDGDTGTNMSQTMASAMKEVNSRSLIHAGEIMLAASKGALMGARGNSGVILSQILRGFAKGCEGASEITCEMLRKMLLLGSETAYKAIMKPKEGTILTVIRVIAEEVNAAYREDWDMEEMMDAVLASGDAILRKTTDMLPQLKQAGVVDSGGKGLCTILAGFVNVIKGKYDETAALPEGSAPEALPGDFVDDHASLEEIKFGYCTEFIVSHPNESCDDEAVNRFRARLTTIGDCVVAVYNGDIVKVHVHTNDPGQAIQLGLGLGELDNIKIDNMMEEFRERQAARLAKQAAELKEFGFVSVQLGSGMADIMRDLGVDTIVDGGQTMNPSIQDIAKAAEETPAKNLFILPNNSNVILAAQQLVTLVNGKKVYVVPTKDVPQGIAALIAFSEDATAEENLAAMTEAAAQVHTGEVTYAAHDSTADGLDIHEGDIMGITAHRIAAVGSDPIAVCADMVDGMVNEDSTLISIYYGADTSDENAQKLCDMLTESYPDCECELHYGGQPIYYYIVSVE